MHVTVFQILLFLCSLCLVFGVWQFLWIVIHKKGYEMEKLKGESFPDFLFRYYAEDVMWKLRKRFVPKWFYYSKMFLIFTKVKGVILILAGLGIAVGLFLLSKSEYVVWLQIEI